MSDNGILTVVGVFVAIVGVLGHLYSMVFNLRKQVREEMDKQMTEIKLRIDGVQIMLQADRTLREETRVNTERELGRTVKYEDMRREIDRLLSEFDKRFHQGSIRRN